MISVALAITSIYALAQFATVTQCVGHLHIPLYSYIIIIVVLQLWVWSQLSVHVSALLQKVCLHLSHGQKGACPWCSMATQKERTFFMPLVTPS